MHLFATLGWYSFRFCGVFQNIALLFQCEVMSLGNVIIKLPMKTSCHKKGRLRFLISEKFFAASAENKLLLPLAVNEFMRVHVLIYSECRVSRDGHRTQKVICCS